MLDFGFRNFQTVSAADYDTSYTSIENDLTIAGLATSELYGLEIDPDCRITLPKSADFSSVDSSLSYDMTSSDPSDAIARIDYRWGERSIGYSYLNLKTLDIGSADSRNGFPEELNLNLKSAEEMSQESASAEAALADDQRGEDSLDEAGVGVPASEDPNRSVSSQWEQESSVAESSEAPLSVSPAAPVRIPTAVWIGICTAGIVVLISGLILLIRSYVKKKEEEDRMLRRQRRLARLEDVGISPDEFDTLLERRRSSYTAKRPPRRRKRSLRRRNIRF